MEEKNLGYSKQINVSKRGYQIIYVEKAKIYVSNSTITYSTKTEKEEKTFNIPYLNSAILMLGTGTSITNEAIRLAANNSLIIIFVNSIYKPSSSTDISFNILSPSSEYKPTEYMQKMAKIYFNEEEKLIKAKELILLRLKFSKEMYSFYLKEYILDSEIKDNLFLLIYSLKEELNELNSIDKILLAEARYTKKIYSIFAKHYGISFKRIHKYEKKPDFDNSVNSNLTHINYFCYGLSASMLTTLGVSFSFPILHGKTRRGALVFDIADIIKDGFSVPLAFYFAKLEFSDKEVRTKSLNIIEKNKIFDRLFFDFKGLLS